jgi:hypothetical protein
MKKRIRVTSDFFTGGQNNYDNNAGNDVGNSFMNGQRQNQMMEMPTDPMERFVWRCAQGILTKNNTKVYFGEEDLVFNFGVHTNIKLRLGRDSFNSIWKLYLKV